MVSAAGKETPGPFLDQSRGENLIRGRFGFVPQGAKWGLVQGFHPEPGPLAGSRGRLQILSLQVATT